MFTERVGHFQEDDYSSQYVWEMVKMWSGEGAEGFLTHDDPRMTCAWGPKYVCTSTIAAEFIEAAVGEGWGEGGGEWLSCEDLQRMTIQYCRAEETIENGERILKEDHTSFLSFHLPLPHPPQKSANIAVIIIVPPAMRSWEL